MTLQAKGRLDGSYQSIGYDGSGGTRHICSRNSLVGVPGSYTTTKDNWTTVFWSNQQGKGPQRDQKVKVGLVLTSTSHKKTWNTDIDVHCTKTVIKLWSKEAHLTSKQPQGLTTTKDVTKSLFPWHTSHHKKITYNPKIFLVLCDFSRHALLGHMDKICSRLNLRPLHHIRGEAQCVHVHET